MKISSVSYHRKTCFWLTGNTNLRSYTDWVVSEGVYTDCVNVNVRLCNVFSSQIVTSRLLQRDHPLRRKVSMCRTQERLFTYRAIFRLYRFFNSKGCVQQRRGGHLPQDSTSTRGEKCLFRSRPWIRRHAWYMKHSAQHGVSCRF